ncbi:MAG: InlB B-repeat-containing protein [Clostridia bacterium]|nr:InlB B-repeat-containing protein [Clostridia bacterium]
MKKHFGKKTLSLLLAALMVLTAVPFAAVNVAAAGGTLNQNGWAIISSNGGRVNTSEGTFTVCNDGSMDSMSVGFIDFDISGISGTVEAKLNVSGKNTGNNDNYNTEAFLEIFSVNPNKRPNVSGADKTKFNSLFGDGLSSDKYANASNAKNSLGILNKPALAVMKTSDMHDGKTVNYSFNISEAINNAKKAGQDKLCLAFINPKSYKGNPVWSDINVYYNTANITYTAEGSSEVAKSASYALCSGSSRGNANQITICSDGSSENTSAAFLKFPISGIPDNATVSLSTSAWRANDVNNDSSAEVYSIDPSLAPSAASSAYQTDSNFSDIFKSFATYSTISATNAKSYFKISGASALGSIKTSELSTSSSKKTVTIDVSSAVKEAKEKNRDTLCLMLINPKSFNGNSTKTWSDIYIEPASTKLVYSDSFASKTYGNFDSGLYYLRITYNVPGNYWDNSAHKAYYRITYNKTNGTGESTTVDVPINRSTFNSAGDKVFDYVIDGYPTSIKTVYSNMDRTKTVIYTVTDVKVGFAIGNYQTAQGVVKGSFNKGNMGTGTWSGEGDFVTFDNTGFPYAKTFDWKASPADTFVSRTGTNTVFGSVVAKDQYGVVMGTNYSATLEKTLQSGSISTISNTGLSVSKQNVADFTVSVSEDAKVENTDYFYGRLKIDVSDANTSQIGIGSKTFKIENQKENITLDPNDGSLSKTDYQIYYGSALNAEINKKINGNTAYPPVATREGYSFKGFYTMSSYGTKIEDNSVISHDATYYAQWDINKYNVNFYDSEGNVISSQQVNYNASATAPDAPQKEADETNHYVFKNWDTEFSSVKSDLEVKPVFETVAHTFERNTVGDKAATCTEDGKVCYKCSACGFTKFEKGESAKGHNWTLSYVSKAATCEEDGEGVYSCTDCHETKTEAIKATGHNYVETIVTERGCETSGLKKYICSNCKKTDPANGGDEGIVIAPYGSHDWTEWETVTAASCTSSGIRKARCNRENCEYHNRYYQETVAPTGHDLSGELLTKESTCVVKGYTYKICKSCGSTVKIGEELPLGEHKLSDWTESPKATCTTGGKKYQLCSVCGNKFNETDVAPLGHDYQNYAKYLDATCTEPEKERAKCSRCNTYDVRNVEGSSPLGHDCPADGFESDNNATCTKDGTESSKCVRFEECGYKETRTETGSALGHNFIGYVYNNDQTCTKNETKTGTCSRCGAKDTVEVPGTKRAHTVDYVFDDNATCTKNGTKSGICAECGEKITVEALNTKIPHKFTTYTVIKEADCISDAIEEASCDYGCGEKNVRFVEGTKGKHDFPDPETEKDEYVSNNDATCKQPGTMSAVCRVCGAAKKTVPDPDSVLRHNIVFWVSDSNATCTEDGTKHGSCVYGCGYSEENVPDVGSALGHWFRDYTYNSDATCTEDGTRTARCEREFNGVDAEGNTVKVRCDETETLPAEGTALGHDWSDWKLTGKDADCTNGGTMERHCKRTDCTASETSEIAPLGHNYKWVTTGGAENDCESGGERVKVCAVCGNVDESSRTIVPGSAHNFAVTEYVAPTCTEEGKRVVSCTVCGKVYSSEIIDKIDHVSYSLDKSTVRNATCNSEGYTGDCVCDFCGEIVIAGSAIEKTNDHVFTKYVTVKQATCTEDAVEKAGCDVCGKVENERTVPSSALGHTFSNYVSDSNATCTGIESFTSKCDRCDVTDTIKKAGTALGHDWSDWTTVVEASCSNKGLAERHCKREGCNTKVEKELRKLSHKESEWIVDKEATCTEEGHRYKKCEAGCGFIFSEEVIPMKDHDFVITESTATCIDDGYSTYKCTACGLEKKGEIVRALGHDYGDWVITKAPTCSRKGEKIVTCQRCGILLAKEEISKTPHRDENGDGKCDDCKADIVDEPSNNCTCICHKQSWAMRVLYAICRFFWKLFRLRSTCPCGAKHY